MDLKKSFNIPPGMKRAQVVAGPPEQTFQTCVYLFVGTFSSQQLVCPWDPKWNGQRAVCRGLEMQSAAGLLKVRELIVGSGGKKTCKLPEIGHKSRTGDDHFNAPAVFSTWLATAGWRIIETLNMQTWAGEKVPIFVDDEFHILSHPGSL